MFYRTGYSGYYRDPRIHPNPDPYSQEWAQMYGYPPFADPVGGNPYLLVSGKRRSRAQPVRSLPPGGDHMSPLYVRTTSHAQQPMKPRIQSGYEFYPSEYYSQYSSAFVSPHYPEVHGNFYHPNLQHSQG
jgi:hypothetical protein